MSFDCMVRIKQNKIRSKYKSITIPKLQYQHLKKIDGKQKVSLIGSSVLKGDKKHEG